MIRVKEAVIVEGKYDKIKLSSIIDGLIIETHGFQIFKDKEQMALLRKLAAERGLLILTDSDGAGFVIRNYLTGCIPKKQVKHAYIPDLFGKEKRKEKPSKEGKLGVEGVPVRVIRQALEKAGVCCGNEPEEKGPPITKADLFAAGLSGGEGSAEKRRLLQKELSLPERLSPNGLLQILNATMTREEFLAKIEKLDS
ncbi:MAG TPA: DUF4093 domain-containing protein [Candidatus Gallacutalibacter pullistercoris]|nr:DUF4093 domain-containing protein [Candidatus Gallacutalibacter pullistercoris]